VAQRHAVGYIPAVQRPTRRSRWLLDVLLWPLLHAGCSDGSGNDTADETSADRGIAAYLEGERDGQGPPSVLGVTLGAWHDDLDGLLARRTIRVLITYSKTHYFLDGLTPRGITADNLKEFSRYLHRELGLKRGTVTLLPIPVARDQMLPYLADGLGDLAIGNLTITPERESPSRGSACSCADRRASARAWTSSMAGWPG